MYFGQSDNYNNKRYINVTPSIHKVVLDFVYIKLLYRTHKLKSGWGWVGFTVDATDVNVFP